MYTLDAIKPYYAHPTLGSNAKAERGQDPRAKASEVAVLLKPIVRHAKNRSNTFSNQKTRAISADRFPVVLNGEPSLGSVSELPKTQLFKLQLHCLPPLPSSLP
jgi:hypothetical protein